jgi:lipid-A-disaccharide synthase
MYRFSVSNISEELGRILPGGEGRQKMLDEYEEVYKKLGDTIAPDNAARIMFGLLNHKD